MLKPYTGPKITNEEVLIELEKLQQNGWEVYALEAPNQYLIDISDDKKIFISFSGMEWTVSGRIDGQIYFFKQATSIDTFGRILDEAAQKLTVNLGVEPPKNTQRIKKGEPASNKIKLLNLIKPRNIKCVYDPFFDTLSLETLLSFYKLGLKFGCSLRCLTGSTMRPRLDVNFARDFENETGVKLEIRVFTSKEHRRFILLSDNKVIIIGCSLNDLNKNEAVRKEESKDDIDFFETEWSVAEKFV